jgi:carbon-monoxide dehydrogenase medium subunit
MSDVQYKVAKTVREAASLMLAAKGKGRILAGGTDLLVQMKSGMVAPGVIIDVKKIPEMTTITETKGSFRIGAATPAAVVGEHKKLKKTWPGVVEAAGKALTGSKLDDAALDAAANACSAACRPIDDKRGTIRYRTKIAGVLLRRATAIARDRANGISHQAH